MPFTLKREWSYATRDVLYDISEYGTKKDTPAGYYRFESQKTKAKYST
jgi:hypothetical protein